MKDVKLFNISDGDAVITADGDEVESRAEEA